MTDKGPCVLVADDEPAYRKLLKGTLEAAAYRVDVASDGADALTRFERGGHNLLLLDIMMPGLDGLELCRHVRAKSSVPIILLTARAEEEHIVEGLRAGADDYVTKPFSVPELVARVEAALRRARIAAPETPAQPVRTGALVVDLNGGPVMSAGRTVTLTAMEYRMLIYMARHVGRVLTYNQLLTYGWGSDYAGEPQLVQVTMSRLRAKVEPNPAEPRHILNRAGIGYILAALPPDQ